MLVNNYEEFASSNLMTAWLREKWGGTSADADTQNEVVYKVWNDFYTLSSVTTIDTDWGSVLWSYSVSDIYWNVIYVAVDSSQNVTARVWKEWDSINNVTHPDINLTDEAVVGRIWLYNNTGSGKTIWTDNLSDFSTVLYEDIVWPAL